ncbi:unnamed protein product [Cunninghamella echinulata]
MASEESNYSAVPPPFEQISANDNNEKNAPPINFNDALQRARAIAEKLKQNGTNNETASTTLPTASPSTTTSDYSSHPEVGLKGIIKMKTMDQNTIDMTQNVVLTMMVDLSFLQDSSRRYGLGSEERQRQQQRYHQHSSSSSLSSGSIQYEDIKVPNNKVGLVIGRGGDTLKKIERNSGARVQIDQDTGDEKRTVKLSGEQDQIQIARDMVEQIIRDATSSSSSSSNDQYGPSSNNINHHQDNTVLVPVPANRVGLVIGRGGDTIRDLERRSGAKLKVLIDRSGSNPNEKTVSVSGDPDTIERAKKLIDDIVNNQPFQSRPGYGNEDGYNNSSDEQSDKLSIPKEFVGLIIGRGGETVRQLKADSGARISVDKYDNSSPDKKTFILQGSPDSIEKAKRLIMEKVESGQNAKNDDRRSSGGYRNGAGGRDFRRQDYNNPYQGDGYNNKNDYYQQDQQYDYSQYQDYYSQQQQHGSYDQYGQQQGGAYDQYGQQQQQDDTQYNQYNYNENQQHNDQYQNNDSNPKGAKESSDKSQQQSGMSQKEIQDATEAYYAQYYGQQQNNNNDSQQQQQQPQQEWTQEAYNQWYQQYYGSNNNSSNNGNQGNNNDQYSNDYYNQQQYNNNNNNNHGEEYSNTTNDYSNNDKGKYISKNDPSE